VRPEQARVTNRGQASTYEQDGHAVTIDMPGAIGGGDHGPSPGYFGRAEICSCLAIGIRMTAVREGLHIASVRVEIAQDSDNRGVLAMPGVRSAPGDTRVPIEIVSLEDDGRTRGMIDRALAHDPWLFAYRDAQTVTTAVSVA